MFGRHVHKSLLSPVYLASGTPTFTTFTIAMGLSDFFIDVSTLPDDGYGLVQLISLGGVYGYILFNASNMISDGSELLLLVPSVAGLVGESS